MPGHFLAPYPSQRPARRPRARVRAGIVYRQIVLERIEVRTREFLNQLQLISMRQPAVGEPEILVEPARVDDQRVAFPLGDRPAVKQRVFVISADLALMAAAVGVDDAVVVVAAADQHEDALARAVFD